MLCRILNVEYNLEAQVPYSAQNYAWNISKEIYCFQAFFHWDPVDKANGKEDLSPETFNKNSEWRALEWNAFSFFSAWTAFCVTYFQPKLFMMAQQTY